MLKQKLHSGGWMVELTEVIYVHDTGGLGENAVVNFNAGVEVEQMHLGRLNGATIGWEIGYLIFLLKVIFLKALLKDLLGIISFEQNQG